MLRRVHDGGIVSTGLRGTGATLHTLLGEAEDGVGGWLPGDTELLHVNDTVGLDDLVNECTHLVLIHRPDLVEAILVTLFEAFEFILEFLELLGEFLVVVGELDVLALKILGLSFELLLDCAEYILVAALLGLERCDGVAVDLFPLLEDLVVELELLLVETVHSLHVFHALFEDLHLLLKLDLLLSLVIGVLRPQVLQLLRVVLLVLSPLVLEVFFKFSMLLEQSADLVLVVLEYLAALVVERLLDVVELVAVVRAHLIELELHRRDQQVDVVVLLLERIHVLVVLGLELLHEPADQLLLLLDDLSAGLLLLVDVLYK